jgi:2-iminobutanoate/2-iminopropanoate deaminase
MSVFPDVSKPVGPYQPAVRAGEFLFCSGQIGVDVSGVLKEGLAEQFKQAMANLESILTRNDLTLESVVKTTVFLIEPDHFEEMNSLYQTYFSVDPPSRSCVMVKGLPKGALVEIEAVGYLGNSQ